MGWRTDRKSLLALQRGVPVVPLHDPHRARRCGVQAQLAQDTLVEVLVDDLDPAVHCGEDVHGARLLELARQLGVAAHGLVHVHPDEDAVEVSHAATPGRGERGAPLEIRSRTKSGISEISSATTIPAAPSRAIFSAAVSSFPSTIVPAWPKLIPGISSMRRPAMKATIGSRESFPVTHAASSASIRPPGSV